MPNVYNGKRQNGGFSMVRFLKKTKGALALIVLLMLPFAALAQDYTPPTAALAPQQIDQMVAQIALYPDPLVGQILMAATYPLEVVEAHRWLQDSDNAQLQGDQLAAAMAQQPWDPSVKSLVAFPQVLTMMNNNLQWTEQLGNAFLAQQADVMNSVQHLRQMAEASGHLASTPQLTVSNDAGSVIIEPANPQVVYVPYYNPTVVYGAWPYPDYPPYYYPWPGYYYGAGLIGFGVGIAVADVLWGWDRWDWRGHRIDIDDRRFAEINGGRAPHNSSVWVHDPAHRHGVPYVGSARAQFQGAADQSRRNFRGYAPAAAPRFESGGVVRGAQTNVVAREQGNVQRAPAPSVNVQQPRQERAAVSDYVQAPRQQRQAPVFESFSRGSDVHEQSQRGAYSRSTMPAAEPARAAPMRAAPSGGGRNQNMRVR
jgi:hypothetical protein